MMNQMMGGSGMMWIVAPFGLLLVVLLVLGIAALAKYISSTSIGPREDSR